MKNRVLRKNVVILLVCMVLFTAAGCMITENRHHPDGTPYTEKHIDVEATGWALSTVFTILFKLATKSK